MPAYMRVSDTERQRTVDELRRHCAAGRIDMDEYGRRIEKAMAAERLEELDAVLSDLPILRIADPTAPGESAGRGPGGSQQRRRRVRRFADIPELGAGRGPVGENQGGRSRAGERDGSVASGRAASTLTAILVVAVVVAAVLLVITASWSWAAVLIGGWAVGMIQSALSRRRSG